MDHHARYALGLAWPTVKKQQPAKKVAKKVAPRPKAPVKTPA